MRIVASCVKLTNLILKCDNSEEFVAKVKTPTKENRVKEKENILHIGDVW